LRFLNHCSTDKPCVDVYYCSVITRSPATSSRGVCVQPLQSRTRGRWRRISIHVITQDARIDFSRPADDVRVRRPASPSCGRAREDDDDPMVPVAGYINIYVPNTVILISYLLQLL